MYTILNGQNFLYKIAMPKNKERYVCLYCVNFHTEYNNLNNNEKIKMPSIQIYLNYMHRRHKLIFPGILFIYIY